MFLHPSLYLTALAFAWTIYWLIPARQYVFRAALLSVFSLSLVSLFVPFLGIALLISSACSYAYSRWICPRWPGKIPAAAAIAIQATLMFLPDISDISYITQGFALAGLAYFTLRNIGFVIDAYKGKLNHDFLDLLFLNSFFPTYSAGPIENIKTFNTGSCDVAFRAEYALLGVTRILIGILKFYFVVEYLVDPIIITYFPTTPEDVANANALVVLVLIILSWFGLYMSFSGYSDIAIGSSYCFGLRVRENFNFPFLARNIQEFWQRWNISIMNFTSEYIYTNYVRVTGRRFVGLFLVFIAIGAWHHLTLNYLVWGLGHASAMALLITLNRKQWYRAFQAKTREIRLVHWSLSALSRLATITFVSLLSAFANASSLDTGMTYLEGLAPW